MKLLRAISILSAVTFSFGGQAAEPMPFPHWAMDSYEVTPAKVRVDETVQVVVNIHRDEPLPAACEYETCWGATRVDGQRGGGALAKPGFGEEGACHVERLDPLHYRLTMTQSLSDNRLMGVYSFDWLALKTKCSDSSYFSFLTGDLFEIIP